jgi:hypothetical protein
MPKTVILSAARTPIGIAFPSLGSPPPKRRSATPACRLDTDSRNDNCSLTTLGAVKRPLLDPNGGCTGGGGFAGGS